MGLTKNKVKKGAYLLAGLCLLGGGYISLATPSQVSANTPSLKTNLVNFYDEEDLITFGKPFYDEFASSSSNMPFINWNIPQLWNTTLNKMAGNIHPDDIVSPIEGQQISYKWSETGKNVTTHYTEQPNIYDAGDGRFKYHFDEGYADVFGSESSNNFGSDVIGYNSDKSIKVSFSTAAGTGIDIKFEFLKTQDNYDMTFAFTPKSHLIINTSYIYDEREDDNITGNAMVNYGPSYTGDRAYTYNFAKYLPIKADKSSIAAKESTSYVGNDFDPAACFDKATDSTGAAVDFTSTAITTDVSQVKTDKPGDYPVVYTYSYQLNGQAQTKTATGTVHVVDGLSLSAASDNNFGKYQLGSGSGKLPWSSQNEIKVIDLGKEKWDLQVSYTTTDDKSFVKFNNVALNETPSAIDTGTGAKDITPALADADNGLLVDYSNVNGLRKNTGTLNWQLTPSATMIAE